MELACHLKTFVSQSGSGVGTTWIVVLHVQGLADRTDQKLDVLTDSTWSR